MGNAVGRFHFGQIPIKPRTSFPLKQTANIFPSFPFSQLLAIPP